MKLWGRVGIESLVLRIFSPRRDREQVGVSGGKILFTARPLSLLGCFWGYQRDSRSENQKLGALPPGGEWANTRRVLDTIVGGRGGGVSRGIIEVCGHGWEVGGQTSIIVQTLHSSVPSRLVLFVILCGGFHDSQSHCCWRDLLFVGRCLGVSVWQQWLPRVQGVPQTSTSDPSGIISDNQWRSWSVRAAFKIMALVRAFTGARRGGRTRVKKQAV